MDADLSPKPTEFLIIGPTASGKSSLSHAWAKYHHGVVISADSRQSYKYLDIGTAKPSQTLLHEVTYFNISILKPNQKDDPVSFINRVNEWKKNIQQPIVYAGGSTLYQQALVFGFDEIPSANQNNLDKLEAIEQEKGLSFLFDWLAKVDEPYSKRMDGLNRQRIFRALDVYMQTGKPFSSFHQQESNRKPKIPVFRIQIEREELKNRIDIRVEQMFEQGLIAEIHQVLEMGYSFSDPGLQTIGYQEWEAFIEGKCDIQEVKAQIKTKTWHYAKRQLTWMKKWDFAIPITIDELNLEKTILEIDRYLQSN